MIKVAAALVSTFVGLALLLSFKSHSAGTAKPALAQVPLKPDAAPPPVPAATSPSTTAATSPSTTATRAGSPKPTAPAAPSGVFTGSPIDTRYGTMQVAAVIKVGRLTDVKVLQQTDGGRSAQIDAAALPMLKSEALAAQSARIDVVSGATYTSEGYAQSLQSALDKARR
jgi:uncharacterized protein with FMN-binding domain